MAAAPAAGEAALGTWALVNALGCVVCLGLLWIWRNTIGAAFADLASFSIGIKWGPRIHPLAPLGSINNAVESNLSSWAEAQQKQMGLAWHYMASLYDELAKENKNAVQNTLALGHWIVHSYVPNTVLRNLEPWKKRVTKAEIAAAGAAAAAVTAKQIAHSTAHTGTTTAVKVQTHVTHAEKTATVAKQIATSHAHTGAQTAVITAAHPSIAHLDVPFGRTISQIKKRLGRAEAWTAAGALSIAMANVLGIPSARCLRDGNIGKVARRLCGLGPRALEDILGILADVLILENVCTLLPLLEVGVADVALPVVDTLTAIGAGLCKGSIGVAKPLQGPMATVPPVTYSVPLAA